MHGEIKGKGRMLVYPRRHADVIVVMRIIRIVGVSLVGDDASIQLLMN